MAGRLIKFPLKMKSGTEIRTIEELRECSEPETLIEYYLNGVLMRWLKAFHYDEEAENISKLDDETCKKLFEVLHIDFSEEKLSSINIDEIKENLEKKVEEEKNEAETESNETSELDKAKEEINKKEKISETNKNKELNEVKEIIDDNKIYDKVLNLLEKYQYDIDGYDMNIEYILHELKGDYEPCIRPYFNNEYKNKFKNLCKYIYTLNNKNEIVEAFEKLSRLTY